MIPMIRPLAAAAQLDVSQPLDWRPEWSLLLNQPANAVHSAGQMIRRTPLEFISSPANPDYDYLLEHDVASTRLIFGGCW